MSQQTSPPSIITGCENSSSYPQKTCSSETENKTAKQACKEIKDMYDLYYKQTKDALGALENWSPAGILKSIGAANKSNQKIQNMISNIQTTLNSSDTESKCLQNSVITQSNIIDFSKCAKIHSDTLIALKDNPTAYKEYLNSRTIENIKQSNKAQITNQCTLNAYIDAINKQEASIENSALAMIMQKSKDLFAQNDSESDQCQFISNEMNACNYLQNRACCYQQNSLNQENILNCTLGLAKDIAQTNEANLNSYCSLTGTTNLSNDQKSKLTNKSEVKVQQTAIGTSLMSFLLFLLVPLLLFGGGTALTAKFAKDLMPFMGLLPLIAGIVFIILYIMEGPQRINRTTMNKPLTESSCSYNYYKGELSTTYKKAKDTCTEDPKCAAVDFIYAVNNDNKPESVDNSITEGYPLNIKGGAIYYDTVGGICDDDPESDEKRYFTMYKSSDSSPKLISGIILIILAIVYTVGYIFMEIRKNTMKSELEMPLLEKR